MLDSARILVLARKKLLELIHRAHQGYTNSYRTAAQLYYWPGMKNDIAQTIDSCKVCQESRPSKAAKTMTPRAPSSAKQPMEEVYNVSGKDWLVMVNRFSRYVWTHQLRRTCTRDVTEQLTTWFLEFGWSHTVRSDGGPQFRHEFGEFCKTNGVTMNSYSHTNQPSG